MHKKPKRQNLKPPGKCIFCGGGNLSKEHVWSEWIHDLLPKERYRHHTRVVAQSSDRNPNIIGMRSSLAREGNIVTAQVRTVCETCNNEWMSELETHVKLTLATLLKGQPAVLTQAKQRQLATWIALKSMVLESDLPPGDTVTPDAERRYLRESQAPPDNWQIWIAHHGGRKWQACYFGQTSTLGFFDGDKPTTPINNPVAKNIHSVTLGVGHLLGLALNTSLPGVKVSLPKQFTGAIRRIWPFESGFLWPPGKTLTDADADYVARTLDRTLGTLPLYPRRT